METSLPWDAISLGNPRHEYVDQSMALWETFVVGQVGCLVMHVLWVSERGTGERF